ncbi:hypothetical protein [Streptomyces clavifer]|uniref:hypothetical protein n=1 Tax=Streptomyces clavifer TaxID=68188 RepID=UPI0033AE2724
MIATTPVGRWTWGRETQLEDKIAACLHELQTAYTVLTRKELIYGKSKLSLSIHEAGKSNSYLFRGDLDLDAASFPPSLAQLLADQVEAALRPGEIGSVYANAKSAGSVVRSDNHAHEEGSFLLGTSAVLDYVSTDLATFSDAWMPYDLKGRAQPTVHSANAPRLSAALRDLSEALHSETDPDDPTHFGKPTEFGVDNYFDHDGTASDVWSSFEIPYRYSKSP